MTIMTSSKKYANIPVPALAIFAVPHVPDAWMTKSADAAIHHAADTYYGRLDLHAEKQAKVFEDGVPGARNQGEENALHIFVE